jgi:hypothetical protein
MGMNLIVIRVQSCAGRKELRTARYDIPSPIDLPESLILSIICPIEKMLVGKIVPDLCRLDIKGAKSLQEGVLFPRVRDLELP